MAAHLSLKDKVIIYILKSELLDVQDTIVVELFK